MGLFSPAWLFAFGRKTGVEPVIAPAGWEGVEARYRVILAESEAAHRAILARHDSVESAQVELDALHAYTFGRINVAWELRMRKLAGPELFDEVEARNAAIRAESATALKSITERHGHNESGRVELLALSDYQRGRSDTACDDIARRHGTSWPKAPAELAPRVVARMAERRLSLMGEPADA
jgi:hypothetical protein